MSQKKTRLPIMGKRVSALGGGDGGNRTRVRNNYLKMSTSLVAELFSAGGSLADTDPSDDPMILGRAIGVSLQQPSVFDGYLGNLWATSRGPWFRV